MRYYIAILLGGFLFLLSSCLPNTNSEKTEINIAFTDPEIQNILQLQDHQDASGLYSYFNHENPAYRYLSVMAFGSMKTKSATDSILTLLKDPVLEVRAAAAYALGQIGESKITDRLVAAFSGKDTLDVDNLFNANILEAVGKIGNENDLKSIATIKTYRSTDSLLLLGQARAIYRMALRNIVLDEGTSRMVDLLYLESTPYPTKLIAAHYLGRAKNINLSLYKVRLTELFGREKNAEIRMPLATAFGNTNDIDYLPSLKAKLISEPDYRVKCNIIRALGHFPYMDIKDIVLPYLGNENIHVASTAAKVIQDTGIAEDIPLYTKYDTITSPWQVRSLINGAILAHTPVYFTKSKEIVSAKIKSLYDSSTDIYAKGSYIQALSKDPFNYLLLGKLYDESKDKYLKITALEGLGNILRNPNFFKAFGNGYGRVKVEILNRCEQAIKSGDVGEVAVAAGILMDEKLQWKEWVKDLTFMKDALDKLKLPRDIEAYNELKACINYFEGTDFVAEQVGFNHELDLTMLQSVGDSSIAAIKTTKGLIRVQLYKTLAPSTVANFVALIKEKFYVGKVFHRVVPNFVIQTGCTRGDGYGSLDYTLRSELPQAYYNDEGYIGMASAGNNTESTQWFITHSPTPHLDGNYTLFGKVVEGMDVVHNIQVGDKINEIIFVK